MYTNLEFEELVNAVKSAWDEKIIEEYIIPIPSKETMGSLVRSVLENNYFKFNNKFYKQKIGVIMGSKCS